MRWEPGFPWNRIAMGLKWSPQAVKGMHLHEEVIQRRSEESSNVYRWDQVRLENLPG
jgi:hypothetical protein